MKKKDAIEMIELLKKTYPDATCSLDFNTPFQLVVAVMHNAQMKELIKLPLIFLIGARQFKILLRFL